MRDYIFFVLNLSLDVWTIEQNIVEKKLKIETL
jgi:hypothetical protein